MKDGPFSRPGMAEEIKTSSKSPSAGEPFARPGDAEMAKTASPNRFPADVHGTPELLKGS